MSEEEDPILLHVIESSDSSSSISSSSTDSDDENAIAEIIIDSVKVGGEPRVTVEYYVEQTVPAYNRITFICHFRVERSLAESLTVRYGNSKFYINVESHGKFKTSNKL